MMYRLLFLICCIYATRAIPVQNVNRVGHPRIIDGESIKIEDAPYQVSIIMIFGGISLGHSCGGSIIDKNHVLTAGHCAMFGSESLTVKSGTTFWATGGQTHNVTDVNIHEDFSITDVGTAVHDVAILKVTPDFDLDDKKEKIIELAKKDDKVKVGDDAYVTGWGNLKNDTIATTLQKLTVNIIDFEECKENYADLGDMTEHNICAKHSSGIKDFCDGDSGGPLVVKGKQVGIVSWSGPGCAIPGRPGVYVDVAKYREWIDKHIEA